MNTTQLIQLSLLLGFGAANAFGGDRQAVTNQTAPQAPACNWQVVTAKKNTFFNNVLEGGIINALPLGSGRAASYRAFVCAKPEINWSSYGQVEVLPVQVTPSNLKKPLKDSQSEGLKTALTNSLKQQFDDFNTGQTGRTLKLLPTVTEVKRTNAVLNVITLAAIQTPISFGGASTHFQLIDGASGVTVGEVTLRGRGRIYDVIWSVTSLGHSHQVLKREPKQVRKEIETLRNTFATAQEAELRTPAGQ